MGRLEGRGGGGGGRGDWRVGGRGGGGWGDWRVGGGGWRRTERLEGRGVGVEEDGETGG